MTANGPGSNKRRSALWQQLLLGRFSILHQRHLHNQRRRLWCCSAVHHANSGGLLFWTVVLARWEQPCHPCIFPTMMPPSPDSHDVCRALQSRPLATSPSHMILRSLQDSTPSRPHVAAPRAAPHCPSWAPSHSPRRGRCLSTSAWHCSVTTRRWSMHQWSRV